MKSRGLLLVAIAALMPLQAAEKPNIVLIFVDDMGAMDLGCYGSSLYQTPRIDQLAEQGTRFTRAYAACHVCSPTRASLQTGKYPARLQLTGHKKPWAKLTVPDWQITGLPMEEITIGEVLKAQGYTTGWFGKWHLGGRRGDPSLISRAQGYDAGTEDFSLNTKNDGSDPKGVFTLTREAIDFMKMSSGQPFFLGLSHYSVHTPIRFKKSVKQKYEKIVEEKNPRQKNAGYAAMVEALDDSVGQLLDWIDDAGISDNTLVLFVSDNGGLLGPTDNTPLRGGKGTLYEGGTRVPMIVRWPGHTPPGKTSDAMFCSIDVLPTFGAVAGAKVPEDLDGLDFSAAFKGGEAPLRETLYWHYPHYHKGMPGGSVRKGKLKLIEWFETGEVELYNLAKDPGEEENLAIKNPEVAQAMLTNLKSWRRKVGAQMMTPNPNFDPKKQSKKRP